MVEKLAESDQLYKNLEHKHRSVELEYTTQLQQKDDQLTRMKEERDDQLMRMKEESVRLREELTRTHDALVGISYSQTYLEHTICTPYFILIIHISWITIHTIYVFSYIFLTHFINLPHHLTTVGCIRNHRTSTTSQT